MPVSCTGPYGKSLEAIKSLISDTTSWITMTDSTGSEDAATYIHIGAVDAEDIVRPAIIIVPSATPFGYRSIGTGTYTTFDGGGECHICIELPVPTDVDTMEDEYISALNDVEYLLLEMMELSGAGDYIMFREINVVAGPWRNAPEQEHTWGPYYGTIVRVKYGA